MNTSNQLFILATILIFAVTVSINYSAIDNYYKYTMLLNTLVLEPSVFSYDPDEHYQSFLIHQNHEKSECITTPNDNTFCYIKNPGNRDGVFATTLVGDNGIDGEIHLDHIDEGKFYFIILNMSKNPDSTVNITFDDRDYKMGIRDFPPLEDFTFSTTIEPFDSFVSHCHSKEILPAILKKGIFQTRIMM